MPKSEIKAKWQFKPSFKLTIFTIVVLPLLVYLGMWQIGKAIDKDKKQDTLQAKQQVSAINFRDLKDPTLSKNQFTAVTIDGIFLNKFTFLLDNQMLEHKPGYRVLTIVSSPHLEKWILIDRGWVPLGEDRKVLPKIDLIFGLKSIKGIINTIPTGIELKAPVPDSNNTWPQVIQTLKYDFIAKQINHPIYEFVIQLQDNDFPHYPYPAISFGITSEKHWGYGVQWFIFATILVIYYLIVSIKRRKD